MDPAAPDSSSPRPWPLLVVALSLAWLTLLGTALLPQVDLASGLVQAAAWVSETGGRYGSPVVTLLASAVFLSRRDSPGRVREGLALFGALALTLGLMAVLNEHLIKPGIGEARPDIQQLAAEGKLGVTPQAFYGLGDKDARRAYLKQVLADVPLTPPVRRQWERETGYSFPSGHALASMTLGACFFTLAWLRLSGARLWALGLLLPWAVAVGYSRPLLRVHYPHDVIVGAAIGLGLGVISAGLTLRVSARPDEA